MTEQQERIIESTAKLLGYKFIEDEYGHRIITPDDMFLIMVGLYSTSRLLLDMQAHYGIKIKI